MLFIFCMSSAEKDDSNAQSGVICEWICETFIEDYAQLPPARQLELQRSISFPVRKGAHLTEYTILGVLLTLTVSSWNKTAEKMSGGTELPSRIDRSAGMETPAGTQAAKPSDPALVKIWTKTAAIALSVGFLYAVSDEVHQIFVPGRAGQLRDVLIDTTGVLLGIFLCSLFFKKACSERV